MIGSRARKIAGDLATRWGRTLLTVAGLAFGLFGTGAVLVALLILKDDLNANFRQTNPPNIVVEAGAVSPELQAKLGRLPGVSAIESRSIIGARVEGSRGRWNPISLFVVEDFSRLKVARFYHEKGAWPPPRGGLLVERDGLFFLWQRIGATLNMRLAGGQLIAPVYAGTAFDPGQAPSRMEQALTGYVSLQTAEDWGLQPNTSRLLVTVAGADAASRPAGAFDFLFGASAGDAQAAQRVQAAAARIRVELAGAGVPLRRLVLQSKLQHPHQFQLNATLTLLAGVAAVCLALAAILIVNLVDSIMTGEQRAIGVMKALGARSSQIGRDYLIGVGALGLVGGLIATPLSLRMGRTIAASIARFLNFEILSPAPSLSLWAVVMAVAVLVPVVVASWRVFATARLPVREALARPASVRGGRLAEVLGAAAAPLPMAPRMAFRALARNPRRAILTAVSLALGLTFFLTALNLRASLAGTVEEVRDAKPWDLQVSFRGRYPVSEMKGWIAAFPDVKGAEFWSSVEGSLASPDAEATNPVEVFATPPASPMLRPHLIAGRWLDPARPDGVVVTQRLLDDEPTVRLGGRYHLTTGDRSQPVTVVGVIREFGPGAIYASPALVAPLIGAEPSGAPTANLMFVTLNHPSYLEETRLSGLIEASVNQSDWRIRQVMTSGVLEVVVKNHLDVIAQLLLAIAALMLTVGAVAMASSISVSVVERYREIGVLKAVGGRSGAIAALFAWEAVLIAALGWGLALAAAPWLSRVLSDAFGTLIVQYPFSYRADPWGPPMALGVAVLIALVAAAVPIRAALKTTPLRALRTA